MDVELGEVVRIRYDLGHLIDGCVGIIYEVNMYSSYRSPYTVRIVKDNLYLDVFCSHSNIIPLKKRTLLIERQFKKYIV